MKYTIVALLLAAGAVVFAQQEGAEPDAAAEAKAAPEAEDPNNPRPRIFQRIIPADVLRDFPERCFASTLCKLFEPEQVWSLEPFCGQSHCKLDNSTGRLFEVVLDCGPKPINPKECQILKPANATDAFPNCCDVYDPKTCQFPDFNAPAAGGQQGSPADAPGGGRPSARPTRPTA